MSSILGVIHRRGPGRATFFHIIFSCAVFILLLSAYASARETIDNGALKLSVDPRSGRFLLESTGGSPDIATDGDTPLLDDSDWPPSSFVTVFIDGRDRMFGSAAGRVTTAELSDSSFIYSWEYKKINISQHLVLDADGSPGLDIIYQVDNQSGRESRIGIRLCLDTDINVDMPCIMDSRQVVIKGEVKKDLSAWYISDDPYAPRITAAFKLKSSPKGVTSKTAFSSWYNFYRNRWKVEPDKNEAFRGRYKNTSYYDDATGIYWLINCAPGDNKSVGLNISLCSPMVPAAADTLVEEAPTTDPLDEVFVDFAGGLDGSTFPGRFDFQLRSSDRPDWIYLNVLDNDHIPVYKACFQKEDILKLSWDYEWQGIDYESNSVKQGTWYYYNVNFTNDMQENITTSDRILVVPPSSSEDSESIRYYLHKNNFENDSAVLKKHTWQLLDLLVGRIKGMSWSRISFRGPVGVADRGQVRSIVNYLTGRHQIDESRIALNKDDLLPAVNEDDCFEIIIYK